uniref:Uncharacterized protein n=1 Tax=Phanerochaete carnosa TaxID=231932 RepID=A0A895KWM6_9APHY|nr:hypothetical protein K8K84_mgp040 [Phanerochaete carnosa]QRZ60412.1 hypothetical protein [Phanerochaete carnosa]
MILNNSKFSTKNNHIRLLNNYVQNKFNIKNYLLGNNNNLVGTIIAFRKGLVKSRFFEYVEAKNNDPKNKHYLPESFAVLLYFDHRVGRIVRYLFNPNLIFWGKEPFVVDYNKEPSEAMDWLNSIYSKINYSGQPDYVGKETNPYLYNIKHHLLHKRFLIESRQDDLKHIEHDDYNTKYLFNGKITSSMLKIFIVELIRDYFLTKNIYSSCDMNIIRENTNPVDYFEYDNAIIKAKVSRQTEISTDKIKYINVDPVLEYPENKDIYTQKSFKTGKFINNVSKHLNINYVQKKNNELPPVINDLKKFINASTIQNKKFLDNRIDRFNKLTELKLSKLSK